MSKSKSKGKKTFKVQTIGDSGVGKTSLLIRLYDDVFYENTVPTIGLDVKTVSVNHEGEEVVIALWDTAGQEQFRTITSLYYRGVHGIILMYDVTSMASFNNLAYWLDEVEANNPSDDVQIILIGNKIDREDREVSREQGLKFAQDHNMLFIETSAKTAAGTTMAFQELIAKLVEKRKALDEDARNTDSRAQANSQAKSATVNLSQQRTENQDQGGGYCC